MKQTNFVAYYRVSTASQGRSGLGLEAQQDSVSRFVASSRGSVIASFTDIESGKRDNRPQLALAIALAKSVGATLLVAKLDRLSRSVGFIFQLRDCGTNFICADMPEFTTLTLAIFAGMAMNERELISSRTKAALAAKKARGFTLGTPANLDNDARSKGCAALRQAAREHPANRHATELASLYRAQGMSLRQIAAKLGEGGHRTRNGKDWGSRGVLRLLERTREIKAREVSA